MHNIGVNVVMRGGVRSLRTYAVSLACVALSLHFLYRNLSTREGRSVVDILRARSAVTPPRVPFPFWRTVTLVGQRRELAALTRELGRDSLQWRSSEDKKNNSGSGSFDRLSAHHTFANLRWDTHTDQWPIFKKNAYRNGGSLTVTIEI